jgi:hypothetical protein
MTACARIRTRDILLALTPNHAFNRTRWYDSFLANIGSGGPVNFAR